MEDCVAELTDTNGYIVNVEKRVRPCEYDKNYVFVSWRIVIRYSNGEFDGIIEAKKNPYCFSHFDYKYAVEFGGGWGYTTRYVNTEEEMKDLVMKLLNEYVSEKAWP